MPDPSVVPWSLCWVGCVVMVSGMVLTLHGIGQRNPSRTANFGGVIATIGLVLLLAPPAINGGLMFFQGLHAVMLEAAAGARPAIPDADR